MKGKIMGSFPNYIAEVEEDTGEIDGTVIRQYPVDSDDTQFVVNMNLGDDLIEGDVHSDHRRIHVFVIDRNKIVGSGKTHTDIPDYTKGGIVQGIYGFDNMRIEEEMIKFGQFIWEHIDNYTPDKKDIEELLKIYKTRANHRL